MKVPKDQLVGELNKGWDVAKYLLGHEREMISGMGLGGTERVAGRGASKPATTRCFAPTIAAFDVDALAFAAMSERFIDELKAGRSASGASRR